MADTSTDMASDATVRDSSGDLSMPEDTSLQDTSQDTSGDMRPDVATDGGPDLQDMAPQDPCLRFAASSRIAHWSFDEPTEAGGYPNEVAGIGVGDLQPIGSPSPVEGAHGLAVGFDGVDDALLLEHSAAFELTEGTVSFWLRDSNPADSEFHSPFSKDADGYAGGGHLQFYIRDSSLFYRLQDTDTDHVLTHDSIQPDAWYHIVGTFGPGGQTLHINGTVDLAGPYQGGLHDPVAAFANTEPIVIGASTGFSDPGDHEPLDGFLAGAVDEVTVFDRQLSPDEVFQFANDCDL